MPKNLIQGDDKIIILDDGTLTDGGHDYIKFVRGESEALLDGYFTAAELHAIANYMEGLNNGKKQ